jgi:biotin carboxylase
VRLTLVASKPTDSVTFGFLPAAARLGLDVVLVTDQPAEHERVIAKSRLLPRPGCVPPDAEPLADTGPVRIVDCDVWDARGLVSAIAALPAQNAIFSNSDHLQTQTALAAAYFDVPGKDWRSAMRAKNKPLMRRRLAGMGIEHVAATEIRPGDRHPVPGLAYPVVLKPAEGVASEDVILVRDRDELREQCALIFARRPGEVLLAEQYLRGGLRTLETLSDGATTWVLGGFRTRVSPLPFFIEERLTWDGAAPQAASEHVGRARRAWRHVRCLSCRVRPRSGAPADADRGERPADRRPLRLLPVGPARHRSVRVPAAAVPRRAAPARTASRAGA